MFKSVKSEAALSSGRRRIRRRMVRAMLGLAVAGAMGGAARAASWDPVPGTGVGDGVVNGGGGIWDLASFNWTSTGGATNSIWLNGDAANFAGTSGGVVSIGSSVVAGSLTFDPTGDFSTYTLQSQTGVETLTLSGPQITTNQDATINAILGGSVGLTKLGAGTLTLGGANTFSGAIAISAGKLRVNSGAALGSASSLAIGGGTFETSGFVGFGGGVSIGPGGGTISLASPGAAVALSGLLSGNSPLTIDGTGGGSLAVTNPANFNGFSNTFTGNIALIGGGSATLAYGIAGQAGQIFSASGGTLALGNSTSGRR